MVKQKPPIEYYDENYEYVGYIPPAVNGYLEYYNDLEDYGSYQQPLPVSYGPFNKNLQKIPRLIAASRGRVASSYTNKNPINGPYSTTMYATLRKSY